MTIDDLSAVGCERWQEAISAIGDGERTELAAEAVDAHVARCRACDAFRRSLVELGPMTSLRRVEPAADLAPIVVRRAATADRRSSWGLARILLGVVAAEVIVISAPDLVLGDGSDATTHAARHLAAFSIAYAVGLSMVVWRPARARTILPVAIVLAGALVITATIDIADGRIPLVGEASHLPELLSVGLVWLLAVPVERSPRWRRVGRRRRSAAEPLRLVEVAPERGGRRRVVQATMPATRPTGRERP